MKLVRILIGTSLLLSLALLATIGCGPSKPPPRRPPYHPCAGKPCGAQCTACPPGDRRCVETMVVKACHPNGACAGGMPRCGGPPPGGPPPPRPAYNPCFQKPCGASCQICPPNDPNCVETQELKSCDGLGRCSASMAAPCPGLPPPGPPPPATGYQPCAGRPCGTPCSLCRPGDTNCVETAVLKFCDATQQCRDNAVQCPP